MNYCNTQLLTTALELPFPDKKFMVIVSPADNVISQDGLLIK
ncbi:hypothetical protein [Anaeromicropila herbilytica]|nr:hypothetical protein [Anaeromicropila herbilytica]